MKNVFFKTYHVVLSTYKYWVRISKQSMSTFKQFVPPCYQQGESDCGYYCLRIAAEITLQRKFNADERKAFTKFKGLCAKVGTSLDLSTQRFVSYFPDMGVYFNEKNAYSQDEHISLDLVRACLDMGKVVVLNITNMDFKGNKLVRSKSQGMNNGHNICCVGYDDTHLIFQDSNKYRKSCRKTMSLDLLQEGYEEMIAAGGDLDRRLKVMHRATYITEMYVADTEEKTPPRKTRRSRRRRR
jgi:hypothetical protein